MTSNSHHFMYNFFPKKKKGVGVGVDGGMVKHYTMDPPPPQYIISSFKTNERMYIFMNIKQRKSKKTSWLKYPIM